MLLSGITILVACGGWAIIIDWRLGLVSIALLLALVVGMMFQVTFNKMMMVLLMRESVGSYCCLPSWLAGPLGNSSRLQLVCCVFVLFAIQTIQASSSFIADQADDV